MTEATVRRHLEAPYLARTFALFGGSAHTSFDAFVKTLLLVHAHPDDESILTGGVIAAAHRDGHRVVLITATRGDAGEWEHRDGSDGYRSLGEARTRELLDACAILGVDRLEMLGYEDSGLIGAPALDGDHPNSFQSAPLEEVAARLARVVREERPDVVVTYSPDGTYGHPDHSKVHTATIAALDSLDDDGWQPAKVYLHAVPRSSVHTVVEAARSAAIELPGGLAQASGTPDEEVTTTIDVSDVLDRKLEAVVAHRSQMHPALPLAVLRAGLFEPLFGVEHFVITRGELGSPRPEPSLFAGL